MPKLPPKLQIPTLNKLRSPGGLIDLFHKMIHRILLDEASESISTETVKKIVLLSKEIASHSDFVVLEEKAAKLEAYVTEITERITAGTPVGMKEIKEVVAEITRVKKSASKK